MLDLAVRRKRNEENNTRIYSSHGCFPFLSFVVLPYDDSSLLYAGQPLAIRLIMAFVRIESINDFDHAHNREI